MYSKTLLKVPSNNPQPGKAIGCGLRAAPEEAAAGRRETLAPGDNAAGAAPQLPWGCEHGTVKRSAGLPSQAVLPASSGPAPAPGGGGQGTEVAWGAATTRPAPGGELAPGPRARPGGTSLSQEPVAKRSGGWSAAAGRGRQRVRLIFCDTNLALTSSMAAPAPRPLPPAPRHAR